MDLMFLGNRLKKVTSSIGDKLSNLDEKKQNKFIYSANEPVSSENGDIWFDLREFKIVSISSGANGTTSPSGNIPVNVGEEIIITFTPNDGYEIDKVMVNNTTDFTKFISIDDTGIGTYVFKNIEENATIFVTYRKK